MLQSNAAAAAVLASPLDIPIAVDHRTAVGQSHQPTGKFAPTDQARGIAGGNQAIVGAHQTAFHVIPEGAGRGVAVPDRATVVVVAHQAADGVNPADSA